MSKKWEKIMQGQAATLVKDAVIEVTELEKHFFPATAI
jgi:hypothetical protein